MKNLNIPPLLQDDYGLENDCTLTSLTSLVCYYTQRSDYSAVYEDVESAAMRYGYSKRGMNPLFIRHVTDALMRSCGILTKAKTMLFKSARVLDEIKRQIDLGNPVLMNVHKAGKYKNHSVLVAGYVGDKLIINDNWARTPQALSWAEVGSIMSINYVEAYSDGQ